MKQNLLPRIVLHTLRDRGDVFSRFCWTSEFEFFHRIANTVGISILRTSVIIKDIFWPSFFFPWVTQQLKLSTQLYVIFWSWLYKQNKKSIQTFKFPDFFFFPWEWVTQQLMLFTYLYVVFWSWLYKQKKKKNPFKQHDLILDRVYVKISFYFDTTLSLTLSLFL